MQHRQISGEQPVTKVRVFPVITQSFFLSVSCLSLSVSRVLIQPYCRAPGREGHAGQSAHL